MFSAWTWVEKQVGSVMMIITIPTYAVLEYRVSYMLFVGREYMWWPKYLLDFEEIWGCSIMSFGIIQGYSK
jgi:hypothetical protein